METMYICEAINSNRATIAQGYGDSKSIAKVHAERAALYYQEQTGMAGVIRYRAPVVAI
jgi:ribosomal protein L4